MSITRKQFLKNAAALFGGTLLLSQKLFANAKQKQATSTCLQSLFFDDGYNACPLPVLIYLHGSGY